MTPTRLRIAGLVACAGLLTSPARAQSPSLRTFTIEKPAGERNAGGSGTNHQASPPRATHMPSPYDAIRTSLGIGYVEGADWGSDILAAGAFSSMNVQLEALVTRGSQGLRFDHGALTLSGGDGRWRVDAGDLFSPVSGAARGARITWAGAGHRQPSLAVYGPRPGSDARPAVLAYHDSIRVGPQTPLDVEVASDGSHLLRSSLSIGGLDIALAYRGATRPVRERDRSLSIGLPIWRGVRLSGGLLWSDRDGARSASRQATLHLPLSRFLDLSIDRTYAASNTVSRVSGASVGVNAGPVRLFHRYQSGIVTIPNAGTEAQAARDQLQSMAEFTPHARVHLALQLATQWTDRSRPQSWEELETTVRITRGTSLDVAVPVFAVRDATRARVRVTQLLPRRYSIAAEYGRVSSFQPLADGEPSSRFRILLRRTFDIRTPAAGGQVSGRVVDQNGRPVAGARVTLGTYSTDSGEDGSYAFARVPRATYDLGLDDGYLPADYAWDGHQIPVLVTDAGHQRRDLVVAPLNAIYGYAYCDANSNGQRDPGEGVAGVAVMLGHAATLTTADGAYRFSNVEPGVYQVRVRADRLPNVYVVAGPPTLDVTRQDDRPVTGADFRLVAYEAPIVWQGPLR